MRWRNCKVSRKGGARKRHHDRILLGQRTRRGRQIQDEALEKMGDHKPAGPYSGGKYSVLEGGTRTPFITYWPGTIKPGVSDEMVCTIDLATSLANHLNVSIPKDACLDSLDVMNALLGKKGRGRSHLVQQDNGRGNNYGYRVGNWKLQRHDSKRKRNVVVTNKLANAPAHATPIRLEQGRSGKEKRRGDKTGSSQTHDGRITKYYRQRTQSLTPPRFDPKLLTNPSFLK